MGQTFIVTNQPPPSSPRPPTPPSVAVNDSGNVEDESGGDLSVTVCEDPSSSPTLSLSAPSSPLEDVSVSCADDGDRSDDYQDLFSSFALQVADGRRQSVTQITSPDDTLVLSIGSESPPLLVDHHQQVDPFLSSSGECAFPALPSQSPFDTPLTRILLWTQTTKAFYHDLILLSLTALLS